MTAARLAHCEPTANFASAPALGVLIVGTGFDQTTSKYATHFSGCSFNDSRPGAGLTVRAAPRPASAAGTDRFGTSSDQPAWPGKAPSSQIAGAAPSGTRSSGEPHLSYLIEKGSLVSGRCARLFLFVRE